MKKMLAVFAALVLALTALMSVAALSEEEESFSFQTYNVKLNVNSQILSSLMGGGTDEDSVKRTSVIAELINNLGIQVVTDSVDAELTLSLKDEPVLTAAILKDEDSFTVLSDILPNSILNITAESLGIATPQVSLDPSTVSGVFTEPAAKLGEELTARIGEPEAVEETLYDVVFTAKTPVNMTTRELVLLLLNTAKEVTSSPDFAKVQELLAQVGVNFDPATIDSAIENVTNSKEEDLPVLDAAVYSNEAGDAVTQLLLTKEEQSMAFRFGAVQGVSILDASVLNQLSLLVFADAAGNTDLNLTFASQPGMQINVAGNIAVENDTSNAAFKVSINDMELVTVAVETIKGGELTGAFSMEGKAEYTLKDLEDQQGEKYAAFMQDIQVGAMTVLAKAMKIIPEIGTLMQQPQTTQPAAQ